MRNQYIYFIGVLLFLCATAANGQPKQKADIEHATVFLSGAELLSTAKVTLPKGESEVLFTNVAGDVKQQSISVGVNNGVVVESTTFRNSNQPSDGRSARAIMMEDSVQLLYAEKNLLENQLAVITEQVTLIQSNRNVSGTNNGLSVAELEKMLNLVNTKLGKLLDDKLRTQKKMDKIEEHLGLLNKQIAEEQSKDIQPGGQLLVKFYTPVATAAEVRFTYVVQNAGWVPMYDLRVDKINAPVKLYYKANVYQNCGVKWDNVKLALSTGNPNETAQAPVLYPMYMAFDVPQPRALKEVAVTQYREPLIQMASPGIHASANSNIDAFGSRGNARQYIVDGVVVNGVADYVQVDNSGVNTTFDIDLPYTVPSDGQQHMVAIKSYELPASYRYYAVPKKDNDVFLQAQVTKWEDLDLLPATTNIYYEGSFVGQGITSVRNVDDTMNFSLGRDKKIIVKREVDKTLRSVKTIGTNARESFAYNISVRNTRKEPINLTLLDQVPVSNDKDILVEEITYKDGALDEQSGEVKWTLNVKPNETQKLKIGYTIKYPRGRAVVMK